MNAIEMIAEKINEINRLNISTETKLIHGDFHCDNLLVDDEGGVLICDWQCVSTGNPSGDISFLSADCRRMALI